MNHIRYSILLLAAVCLLLGGCVGYIPPLSNKPYSGKRLGGRDADEVRRHRIGDGVVLVGADVGVVGAGVMGSGIAQWIAARGGEVGRRLGRKFGAAQDRNRGWNLTPVETPGRSINDGGGRLPAGR